MVEIELLTMAPSKNLVYAVNALGIVLIGVFVLFTAGPTVSFYGIDSAVTVISLAVISLLLALVVVDLAWLFAATKEG